MDKETAKLLSRYLTSHMAMLITIQEVTASLQRMQEGLVETTSQVRTLLDEYAEPG